jgi:PRTRC genetic system protein E
MFTELKALLENRSLTLTVATVKDGKIRVCVIPQSTEKDEAANKTAGYRHKEIAKIPEDAISALTTPLSLTGTPEELDAELPTLLVNYVERHVGLQESFDQAVQQISDAVKAIDEREKNKPKQKAASKQEDKAAGVEGGSQKASEPKKKPTDELPPLWCAAASNTAQPGASDSPLTSSDNQQ